MAKTTEQITRGNLAGTRWPSGAIFIGVAFLLWCSAIAIGAGAELPGWLATRGLVVLTSVAGTAALCLLPGLALLRWLWGALELPWPERLALAWGLGAALPPLLLMALHLLRLPWPGWLTIVYLAASALALVLSYRHTGQSELPARITMPPSAALLLAGLTFAALIARLFTARDLLVGANVDSYHHTMIAQLLVDRQGLFTSWEPYAPLTTFTYHYGFHANVAFVHHLTGIPVPELLPLVGQVMGAIIVPLIYALTTRLSGSSAAGLWAAAIVGFLNTQPAYYVVWGRFPFITSHLLLIAALICWMHALEQSRLSIGPVILAALISASLAHTHYQTTILAALLIGCYLFALLMRSPDMRAAGRIIGRAALIGAIALIIAAPWLINTISGNLDRNAAFNSDRQSGAAFAGLPVPPLTPLFLKMPIIGLGLVGLLFAFRRHDWRAALPAIWGLAIFFTSLPYLVGLPGTGAIEPIVALMTLYLAAAPLAALPPGYISEWLGRYRAARLITALTTIAFIWLSAWGIAWQRDLVPAYDRTVTPADIRAISWVESHTPADSRFLVASHPIYSGLIVAGTDAGWWLPLLAGRQTTVPPMTYGSELHEDPAFLERTHRLIATLRRAPLTDERSKIVDLTRPEALEALHGAGVNYIYIGAQPMEGPLALPAIDHIDIARLRASPDFQLAYADGGVSIFQVLK